MQEEDEDDVAEEVSPKPLPDCGDPRLNGSSTRGRMRAFPSKHLPRNAFRVTSGTQRASTCREALECLVQEVQGFLVHGSRLARPVGTHVLYT